MLLFICTARKLEMQDLKVQLILLDLHSVMYYAKSDQLVSAFFYSVNYPCAFQRAHACEKFEINNGICKVK